ERWRDRQLDAVTGAVAALPPDLTVVLIARGDAPEKLKRAVEAASGEAHEFAAPSPRAMPKALVAEAERLGFRLEPQAARARGDRGARRPRGLVPRGRRLRRRAGAHPGGAPGGRRIAASPVARVQSTCVLALLGRLSARCDSGRPGLLAGARVLVKRAFLDRL